MSFFIIVEGLDDEKFLSDFIQSRFPDKWAQVEIKEIGGYTEILNQKKLVKREGELNEKKIAIIFDADNNHDERIGFIEDALEDGTVPYSIFLFPDNENPGILENLLEGCLSENGGNIWDCYENYFTCVNQFTNYQRSIKDKIAVYGNAFQGSGEFINTSRFDFQNTDIWNLEAENATPLFDFLNDFFS